MSALPEIDWTDVWGWRTAGPPLLPPGRSVSIRECARIEAERAGLALEDVLGRSRRREVVRARWRGMAIARAAGYSAARIGRVYGRDHTSVMHGVRWLQEGGGRDGEENA